MRVCVYHVDLRATPHSIYIYIYIYREREREREGEREREKARDIGSHRDGH